MANNATHQFGLNKKDMTKNAYKEAMKAYRKDWNGVNPAGSKVQGEKQKRKGSRSRRKDADRRALRDAGY